MPIHENNKVKCGRKFAKKNTTLNLFDKAFYLWVLNSTPGMKRTSLFHIILLSCIILCAFDNYKPDPLVDVIHYKFGLRLNDSTNIIEGNAEITLKFRGNVRSFSFDLRNINSSGKGMVVKSISLDKPGFKWEHSADKLTITPSGPLSEGSEILVNIIWSGIPADGLIISKNKFGDRTFFADHWPDRASNYLPVVDHPSDKATVEFIITAPSHYKVVGSGYLTEEKQVANDYTMTHWKEDVPLAVKVMAFGAAPFAVQLAGTIDNIPVTTWVYDKNAAEGFSDYAVAVKPLAFYDSIIGPYPYEKLANVQSKTIFGGLENAGCIFYSENSVTGQGRAESLIAHELAHQWFGNSVTEKDWHHIWLSEGFATYMTSVYLEKTYGSEKFMESMRQARERVLRTSEKSPGSVIDTTITDLMKLLSANSYQKGAWVLHMLRNEIGDDLFWQGMRLFYNRFRNGNALSSDFEEAMEDVSKKELGSFFNQWLLVPGQPEIRIITVSGRKKGTTDIVITQLQEHLFNFPIEIKISDKTGARIETVNVTGRDNRLNISTVSDPEIVPDPNVKLLFRLVNDKSILRN
jgi:aminopeptidase N